MENETNNDSFDKDDLINILKLGEIDIDVKEDYFTFYWSSFRIRCITYQRQKITFL